MSNPSQPAVLHPGIHQVSEFVVTRVASNKEPVVICVRMRIGRICIDVELPPAKFAVALTGLVVDMGSALIREIRPSAGRLRRGS